MTKVTKVKNVEKQPETLQDLKPGEMFKYPSGAAIYQVCSPTGNLAGLYTVGRSSKKPKVWVSNVENGNIVAVDNDKVVVSVRAEIQWSEN